MGNPNPMRKRKLRASVTSAKDTQIKLNTNKKQLTVRIDEPLHREFKAFVSSRGESINDVVTRLINSYIENNKPSSN
jgi:parG